MENIFKSFTKFLLCQESWKNWFLFHFALEKPGQYTLEKLDFDNFYIDSCINIVTLIMFLALFRSSLCNTRFVSFREQEF